MVGFFIEMIDWNLIERKVKEATTPKVRFSQAEYREYLKTEHWKQTRKEIADRDPICRICESTKTQQVHHLNYRNIFDVTPEDLIGVCDSCHTKIHSRVLRGSNLTIKELLRVLKSPFRVKIDREFISKFDTCSTIIQRLAKGILSVTDLDFAVGKRVAPSTISKLKDLLDRRERIDRKASTNYVRGPRFTKRVDRVAIHY